MEFCLKESHGFAAGVGNATTAAPPLALYENLLRYKRAVLDAALPPDVRRRLCPAVTVVP